MKKLLIVILLSFSFVASAQQLNIALLKYRGGGDWYGNPTSLPNLVRFCNQEIGTDINPNVPTVEPLSPNLFNYPYVYMTGHGNVVFDAAEAQNLRNYMLAGGFLHIDDNYGIRQYIEPQMKKVFPELDFVELPYTHEIFRIKYQWIAIQDIALRYWVNVVYQNFARYGVLYASQIATLISNYDGISQISPLLRAI